MVSNSAGNEMALISNPRSVIPDLELLGSRPASPRGPFNDVCNHLLQEHKLNCLHVGHETRASETGPWHSTMAVFAK
jgi:hypothetical protein